MDRGDSQNSQASGGPEVIILSKWVELMKWYDE